MDSEAFRLIPLIKTAEHESFFNYFRISPESFDNILNGIGPDITRLRNHRFPIGPKERFMITLRYHKIL